MPRALGAPAQPRGVADDLGAEARAVVVEVDQEVPGPVGSDRTTRRRSDLGLTSASSSSRAFRATSRAAAPSIPASTNRPRPPRRAGAGPSSSTVRYAPTALFTSSNRARTHSSAGTSAGFSRFRMWNVRPGISANLSRVSLSCSASMIGRTRWPEAPPSSAWTRWRCSSPGRRRSSLQEVLIGRNRFL